MRDHFTAKERAFIAAYIGPAQGKPGPAAKLAGYSDNGADVTGYRLLRRPRIKAEIERLSEYSADPCQIANTAERRVHLTTIARNEKEGSLARVKAIDTLNKMDGLYVSKHLIAGNLSGPAIVQFVDVDTDGNVIEAEKETQGLPEAVGT